jgi:hypothetical protein
MKIDATIPQLRDPGGGFKRAWPLLIRMDESM